MYRKIGMAAIVLGLAVLMSAMHDIYKLEQQKYLPNSYDYAQMENRDYSVYAVAQLVGHYFPVQGFSVTGDKSYFLSFAKPYFGTLRICFDEPLSDDENIIVTLGEKACDKHVWSKADGGVAVGNGIESIQVKVTLERGRKDFIIPLPERSLPVQGSLPEGVSGVVPFRYCSLEGLKTKIAEANVQQLAVFYPFDDMAGRFESDNEKLNRVWQLCKHTIKATNFAGIYVDGNRERLPYEADAYINQLGHYAVDYRPEVARRTLLYLLANPTWPTEWSLHAVFMAYEDYIQTGDKEFLRQIYPAIQSKCLQELADDDGLISSNRQTDTMRKSWGMETEIADIIDWPESERDGFAAERVGLKDFVRKSLKLYKARGKYALAKATNFNYAAASLKDDIQAIDASKYRLIPVNTVVNSFYYKALKDMEYLAGELGKNADAAAYAEAGDKVRRTVQERLINEDKLFVDGEGTGHVSLHANMFALAFGLVPEENKQAVITYLKGRGMACSVYGAQYLLEGLCSAGEAEYALRLMTDEGDRGWLQMMDVMGSGMTTEAWSNEVKPNQDWSHAWGTAPLNIVPRGLFGIRATEPGYKRFNFIPQIMGLVHRCELKIPVSRGSISVGYDESDEAYNFIVDVPEETSGELYFPVDFLRKIGSNSVYIDGYECMPKGDKIGCFTYVKDLSAGRHMIVLRK